MTTESTYTIMKPLRANDEQDHALALLHIGMMLAEYGVDEQLPRSTAEAQGRVQTIFNINMWNEPDIYIVRNKMVAIIEQINQDQEAH